MMIDIMGDCG